MPSAATLEDLDRRVTALEHAQNENTQSLKWLITKVARIQAVQDEHSIRLDRIEGRLEKIESRLDRLEAKVDALPRALAEMLDERDKNRKT